jgi:hypothetical protein
MSELSSVIAIFVAFQPDKRQLQISFPIFTVISFTSNKLVFGDESLVLCRSLSIETRSWGKWEIVGKFVSSTGSGNELALGEVERGLLDEVISTSPLFSTLDARLSSRAHAKDA